MCGRFKLVTLDEEAAAEFGVPFVPPNPRYNIAPTQSSPVVRVAATGGREWADLRWGLVPSWAKDLSIGSRMINARSETAAQRPAFRDALRRRRCLVPADGFYEWSAVEGGRRQPYLIRRVDRRPFAFAGLWERWSPPDAVSARGELAEFVESFTILTTIPNAMIARLHDRMPVILPRSAFDAWLDPDLRDAEALRRLFVPSPDALWEALPVGPFVNRATLDAPVCAEPLVEEDARGGGPAGGQQILL
jgi:putative SOS response-associated peptidase YedK